MVTKALLDKLSARVEELSALLDPDAGFVTVIVFAGETPEYAAQRHCTLRPEHAGRRIRCQHRPNPRTLWSEWAAVWLATASDQMALQNFIAENSAASRNFVGFNAEDEADPSDSIEPWERAYCEDMHAAGLSAPQQCAKPIANSATKDQM